MSLKYWYYIVQLTVSVVPRYILFLYLKLYKQINEVTLDNWLFIIDSIINYINVSSYFEDLRLEEFNFTKQSQWLHIYVSQKLIPVGKSSQDKILHVENWACCSLTIDDYPRKYAINVVSFTKIPPSNCDSNYFVFFSGPTKKYYYYFTFIVR